MRYMGRWRIGVYYNTCSIEMVHVLAAVSCQRCVWCSLLSFPSLHAFLFTNLLRFCRDVGPQLTPHPSYFGLPNHVLLIRKCGRAHFHPCWPTTVNSQVNQEHT